MRSGLIGCAAVGVLLIGAVAALFAWGGITVVSGDRAAAPAEAGRAPARRAERLAVGEVSGGLLTVPVAGVRREDIEDSWGDPRENGKRSHHGTDLMAPRGTPVLAAAEGTVEKLFESVAGGTTLYVRSLDRRTTYYYAHLSGYAPGLHEGQVVKAGDPLAFVGDTGDAGPGNYHLHFGVTLTTPDQHWYQGRDVNPYPLLAGKPSRR